MAPMKATSLLFPVSCILFATLLAGCGKPDRMEITQKRNLNKDEQTPKLVASSQERFKFVLPQTPSTTSGPRFVWDTPEGWKEAPDASPMRQIDLRFGDKGEGEIYLTRAGGSLEDNVNRWRQQMGLEPAPSDEINSLPRRPLLGGSAVIVKLDGEFTGMGESSAAKDYRMLGAILQLQQVSVFVKMVGPRSLVEANEEEFNAFCDSLRVEA